MPATTVPGRYDIVMFPNGGWECIGRQAAIPPIPASEYRPRVDEYVAQHSVEKPTKMTMYYRMEGDACTASWMPYAGEIQSPEEEGDDLA